MRQHFFIFSLFLLLSSCATISQKSPSAQNAPIDWDLRVKTLSSIQNWDLKGLIAIRASHDAGSAQLQWEQKQNQFHLTLLGPLGAASYELTGQPGQVELATGDGRRFYAKSPEELLAQQSGWQLPVSNLYFWVRGLPVPDAPAKKTFDAFHHLTELQQEGWQIHFLSYSAVHGIDVPNKIFLEHPPLSVKIVVHEWKFLSLNS